MPKTTIRTEEIVQRAARLRAELQSAEADTRLSAPGFLADALAVAGIDRRRLDELRAILSQQRDRCAGIAAFVRAIAGLIREARFGGAPRNPARLRPYTSPEGLAEMAALQSTAPDWVAVAVAQVAETHPEALVASTIGTSTRRT